MRVQPYLYFDGRCEEAIEFYRDALGGSAHAHAIQQLAIPTNKPSSRPTPERR